MERLSNYGWLSEDEPESCNYVAPRVLSILSKLKAQKVIDIGAGNGALCRRMAREGYNVVGLEPDKQGFEIARRHCPAASFYRLGVEDSPKVILADYPAGFEVAISTEVIEHLYDPRLLLRFSREVLADRGFLILTTPYHGYLKNIAISIVNGWDRHLNPQDRGHIKFFSHKTMSVLLESEGFEVCKLGGVGRVPWMWKSMFVLARKR